MVQEGCTNSKTESLLFIHVCMCICGTVLGAGGTLNSSLFVIIHITGGMTGTGTVNLHMFLCFCLLC